MQLKRNCFLVSCHNTSDESVCMHSTFDAIHSTKNFTYLLSVAKANTVQLMKKDMFSIWNVGQTRAHTHSVSYSRFVYDFVKLSAESGFVQQMNFIAVLSNHICDLWTASARTISIQSFRTGRCIIFRQNVQIGVLSHTNTIHSRMHNLNGCKHIFCVWYENLWPA